MFKVMVPQYRVVGKTIIKGKEEDLFAVYFKQIGTAKSMVDAKKKYGKITKHPVLEEIKN